MTSPVNTRPGLAAVAVLSLAGTATLVWGSQAGGSEAHALLAVLLASALGGLALLWTALDARLAHAPLWAVLLLAVMLRLLAAAGWPLLEDDHHRYLWDGLRTVTTGDPYSLPPSAFFGDSQLPQAWQDTLSGINNPDVPTIYGPVLQGLFALSHLMAPGRLGALQCLLVLVDMALLLLLAHQGVPKRWLLAYAVHPLVLKEAMASAHPDGLLALFLMLAVLMWQRRWAWGVGLLLGLAVATKVAALVTVPLFLVARRPASHPAGGEGVGWAARVLLGLLGTVGAAYLPLGGAGGSDLQGLSTFAQQWRFNPLLWRLLELVLPAPWARPAGALLVLLLVLGLTWLWQRRRRTHQATLADAPPVDVALVLLLLFSPVVNAWYWLWVLALSLALGRTWVAAVAVVAPLAYINSTVLQQAGVALPVAGEAGFVVPWPLAWAQVLVLLLAAWRDGTPLTRRDALVQAPVGPEPTGSRTPH